VEEVYLLALGANITFAIASLIFTQFSRRFNALWMNCYKAIVAFVFFGVFFLFNFKFDFFNSYQFFGLMLSGFIGLGIGDVFLLHAFKHFGAGRTLMVFGFQPFFIGILSYILFGQEISTNQMIAILLFIACLLTIGHEYFQANKRWEVLGLLAAIGGILFDAIGIIITRYAFDLDPRLTAMEGNFYRCIGGVLAFVFIRIWFKINLIKFTSELDLKENLKAIFASALGTFIALGLYLKAVQTGHLASISAIAITGSLFSATAEHIQQRKWPNMHLWLALSLFLAGAYFLY